MGSKFKYGYNTSSQYWEVIKRELPPQALKRVPSRLVWLVVHLIVIGFCVHYILSDVQYALKIILGLALGHSLGIISFLGHEVLHGTVIRNKYLIRSITALCFVHWGVLPNVWNVWHNRKHHVQTQKWTSDPDTFGHVLYYGVSKVSRIMEKFAPGSGCKRSYLFMFFWFSFKSFLMIFVYPYTKKEFKKRYLFFARAYYIFVFVGWITVSILLDGLSGLLLLMILPLAAANFLQMIYISTNHFLNPTTNDVNDPLVNTLTVYSNKLIHFLHLNFNYHVEHHIAPQISPKYAPLVAKILKEKFHHKYQEMNHLKAVVMLYKTPRYYKTETRLINPRTKETAPTLLAEHFEI